MFDELFQSKTGSKSESGERIETIIGEETNLKGDLVVSEGVRIDGKFVGSLKASGRLTVGKGAVIESDNVSVQEAVIAGKVDVNELNAPQGVQLTETAEFSGDLKTKKLVIEEGAVFQGNSKMQGSTESNTKN